MFLILENIFGVINYCVLLLLFLQRYILGSIEKCNISDYKCLLPCNIVYYIVDLTWVINAFRSLERIVIKLSVLLLYTCFLSLRIVTYYPGLVKMLSSKISNYLAFLFGNIHSWSYQTVNVNHGEDLLSPSPSWVANCLKQLPMWTMYDLSSVTSQESFCHIVITEVLAYIQRPDFTFPCVPCFLSP